VPDEHEIASIRTTPEAHGRGEAPIFLACLYKIAPFFAFVVFEIRNTF
jgi:hypothetical protein